MFDLNIFKFEGTLWESLKKPLAAVKSLRSCKLEDFFNEEIKSQKIDYLFYQFGLRPKLPLMDVLYLEYLHSLVIKEEVGSIMIFPTIDLSSSRQKLYELTEFETNVKKIFKGCESRVEVDNPFAKDIDNEDLTSDRFLQMLRYIGSRRYFDYLQSDFGIEVGGIEDFNIYHAPDDKLLTIFTHLIRGWQISKRVKSMIEQTSSSKFGFIFWETEFDKLGVFKKLAEDYNLNVSFILGRTILDDRKRPLPIANNALMMFDDESARLEAISRFSRVGVKKHVSIVECILRDNYGKAFDNKNLISEGKRRYRQWRVKNHDTTNLFTHDEAFKLISLIHKLRRIYDD